MKTSEHGLAFISKWEGEVDRVYKDRAGVSTIGVGHALRPGEIFADGITHEQALDLLAGDVSIAENAVNQGSTAAAAGTLSQNAFDACVSLAFNCGGGAFAMSSVRRLLNEGDMQGAAKAFLLWCRCTDPHTGQLVVDAGLLHRRQAEAALFLTPDATT